MAGTRHLRIDFTAEIEYDDRGDYWAARMASPFGFTVYGDTFEDAEERLQEAARLYITSYLTYPDGVAKIRAYFDSHGVLNTFVSDEIPRIRLSETKKMMVKTIAMA